MKTNPRLQRITQRRAVYRGNALTLFPSLA